VLSLRDFIAELRQRLLGSFDISSVAPDGILRTRLFALDVTAVFLPSDMLVEDRVSQINRFWDLRGEREVLVVAGSAPRR